MSSSDTHRPGTVSPSRRMVLAAGMTLAFGLVAGCTARPLYGNVAPAGGGTPLSSRLASVDIPPASGRVGQELRNHLIFMFGGGQGRPGQPAYRLDLTTNVAKSVPVTINTGQVSLEPTAGTVSVRASYRLTEIATGQVIATGNRAVQAPYDIPAQEFAAERAVRDAENRAARELAELLRLVVAQDLER